MNGANNPLITQLTAVTEEHLSEYLDPFTKTAHQELLKASDQAVNNRVQTDLLFASSRIEKDAKILKKLHLEDIRKKFTQLPQQEIHTEPSEDTMDLVDQKEFDEWVVIISIARKFDGQLLNTINQLEHALGEVVDHAIPSEESPFTPYSLLWSLKGALTPLNFSIEAKQIIYRAYQETLLSHLMELYKTIRDIFEERGVSLAVKREHAEPHYEEAGENKKLAPAPKVRGKSDIAGALSTLGPGVSGSPVRRLGSNFKPVPKSLAGKVISKDVALRTLAAVPITGNNSVCDRIREILAEKTGVPIDQVSLDDLTRNSIETAESLIDAIERDEYVGSELRSFITDLEIPLIKENINNPDFLNDPNHPGRRLLHTLGQLAPFVSAGQSDINNLALLESLKQISHLIVKRGNSDLPAIEKRMETLLKLQKQQFDENIGLVLSSAQSEETRQRAQVFVLDFLEEQLTSQKSPTLILKLLGLGWAGLLVKTASEQSKQSKSWHTYSGVIKQLLELFNGAEPTALPDAATVETLMTTLKLGFQEYPVFEKATGEFLKELHSTLTENLERFISFAAEKTEFTRDQLKSFLPDYSEPDDHQALVVTYDDPELSTFIQAARQIRNGDWIAEHGERQPTRLLNLGWKSTNSLRFIFVDGAGRKALDIPLNELAIGLRTGIYSTLENGNLPLVDRAVHRLLQKTYDQFRHESDRDELTGLLSRKAFQRMVTSTLTKMRSDHSHSIFMTIDIDRFRVINDICGIEGGDGLLTEIATLLHTYSPREAFLARVGDDEFGILIPNCNIQRGYEIAERQRKAVDTFKFLWNEQALSITASVGVVPIDTTITSITELLNASVAACNQARKEGRNCTRVYHPSAEEYMTRRKIIQVLPEIDKAIENSHLKLYGQLITPIGTDGSKHPHYEILLRVYDEENELASPVQFINAAEQYDRARQLDKWVVSNAFAWLGKHQGDFVNNESFSINLSAQTLTDLEFSDYIKKELSEVPYPLERIAFEITETAFINDMERVKRVIHQIKEFGCQFYLDDFGSGYSSYSYLKEFPVDVVKVDGIFVKDIYTEKSSYAMVKSITEVAHFMDKQVVAEFVSSQEVLDTIKEIGVDYAQGYAVGKPCDLNELLLPAIKQKTTSK